jgi:hypothetical protein
MKELRLGLNECRSYWSEADGGKQNRVHEASSGRGPRPSLQDARKMPSSEKVKKASTQKSLRVHVKDRRTHLKHFQ